MEQKQNKRSVEDRPIFRDISEDVTTHFQFSHNKFADEITIVLKGHLYIEYMLDIIIREKIQIPNPILKYSFAKVKFFVVF